MVSSQEVSDLFIEYIIHKLEIIINIYWTNILNQYIESVSLNLLKAGTFQFGKNCYWIFAAADRTDSKKSLKILKFPPGIFIQNWKK